MVVTSKHRTHKVMEAAIRELMGAGTPPRFKFKDTYASIEFPSGYTIPAQATLEAKYDELLALEEGIQKTVMEGDLEVGTSNLFVDTETGNVGIGTTNPAYTLDVAGTAYLSNIASTDYSKQFSQTYDLDFDDITATDEELSLFQFEPTITNHAIIQGEVDVDILSKRAQTYMHFQPQKVKIKFSFSWDARATTGSWVVRDIFVYRTKSSPIGAQVLNYPVEVRYKYKGDRSTDPDIPPKVQVYLRYNGSNFVAKINVKGTYHSNYTDYGLSFPSSIFTTDGDTTDASVDTMTTYDIGTGKVGIGTSSPNRQLQIYGDSSNYFSFSPTEADDTSVDDKTNFGATSMRKQMMMRLNNRTWYWGIVNNASNCLGLGADGGGGDDPDIPYVFQNDGTFWTKNIRTSGNVGIGTTSPGRPLEIAADGGGAILNLKRTNAGTGQGALAFVNLNSNVCASVAASRTGAEGGNLVFYTIPDDTTLTSANPYLISERMRITSGGNVGIGTTSPSHPLTIQETTTNTNTVTYPLAIRAISSGTVANGFGAGIRFQCERRDTDDYQSLAGSVEVYGGGGLPGTSDLWNMRFGVRNNDTTVTPMTLRYDGNVGIGTTNPAHQLHIGPRDNNHIYLASANNRYGWILDTDDQGNGTVPFRIIKRRDNVDITTVTIDNASGNVGIGTASPGSLLTFYKDYTVPANGSEPADDTTQGITFRSDLNSFGASLSPAWSNSTGVVDTAKIWFQPKSYQGISGSAGVHGYLAFGTGYFGSQSNTPDMVINTEGNVGIGTTNPGYKLDVQGDINSTGKINMGDYAVVNGYMSSRTLTVGSITSNYGGGNSWNANTAAILLECTDNTEIAAHDSGTRLSSLMYYEGASTNRITIGRDMGWGTIASVRMCGSQSYPNRPVAVVGKSSGRVYSPNVIVYNSVLYNDGGLYNTSNGRFTAPTGYAGYYLITYTGLGGYQETGPNTRWRLNGNDLSWGAAHINASPCTSRWGLTCQFIYYLNAGDYLTHRVITGSIYGSASVHSTTVVMFMGSR